MSKCEHHNDLIKKIEKLEKKTEDKEKRIIELERRSDVHLEKFGNIMATLERMEGNIQTIANALQENRKRPLDLLWKVAAGLILLGLGVAIGWR